jgi:hypothetical protein
MKYRTAVTLVEVLVAIFVMAIGLLALLTLFPLGALRMAQAIKDDRTAHAAANAAAIAEARNIRQDTLFTAACANPYNGALPTVPAAQQVLPNLNTPSLLWEGPSYPVYVDPFGRIQTSTWAGGLAIRGMPRRTMSFVGTNINLAYRWCSLLDDLQFDGDGKPVLAGNFVERDIRYSWAYLLRRPKFKDPAAVDLTVVVYSGRSLQLVLGERAYEGIRFDRTSRSVAVPWTGAGQDRPPVKKGGWILDATMAYNDGTRWVPEPHGFFYRVSEVTDGPGNQIVLQLETNPRLDSFAGTNNYGVLVVLENVVEVFEKGLGWKP